MDINVSLRQQNKRLRSIITRLNKKIKKLKATQPTPPKMEKFLTFSYSIWNTLIPIEVAKEMMSRGDEVAKAIIDRGDIYVRGGRSFVHASKLGRTNPYLIKLFEEKFEVNNGGFFMWYCDIELWECESETYYVEFDDDHELREVPHTMKECGLRIIERN